MSETRELLDLIKWDVPPPKDLSPYIPILSPKPGDQARGLIVSPHMVGVETHYLRNRTKPCIGAKNGCEGCGAGLAVRWKGYLGVWNEKFSRYMLAEITHSAAVDLRALLDDKAKSLRGMVLLLWRVGKHKNAPVKATIEGRPANSRGEVPADIDVRKALLRIWERRTDDVKEQDAVDHEEEIPL